MKGMFRPVRSCRALCATCLKWKQSKAFPSFLIGLKGELQAGRRGALTKLVTIKAPLGFCGKFGGKLGNFFRFRGEIVFCLQIAAKLCKAMLIRWLLCCGILNRGNHQQAGGNRTEKKTDHVKIVDLETRR